MKTKTVDQMADSEVLAMALDEMEFFGLLKWKPDADQKPDIVETRAKHMANDQQAAA